MLISRTTFINAKFFYWKRRFKAFEKLQVSTAFISFIIIKSKQ